MRPGGSEWIFPDGFDDTAEATHAGFVYLITNRVTGRAYVGKKFFTTMRKRTTALSDWRRYFGSSTALKADVRKYGKEAFTREILSVHRTKTEVNFAEVEAQFVRRVLHASLPDGSRAFYNANIAGKWFARAAS